MKRENKHCIRHRSIELQTKQSNSFHIWYISRYTRLKSDAKGDLQLSYLFNTLLMTGTTIAVLNGLAAFASDPRAISAGQWKIEPPTRQALESKIAQSSRKLEVEPNDGSAYKTRAFAYYSLEQFDKASSDFEKVVQLAPKLMDAEAYQTMGVCYSQDEKLSKAISCFSKSINLTTLPNLPASDWRKLKATEDLAARHLRRAQALAGLNRTAEALLDANEVVILAKDKYWPLEFRARLNTESGHYKEALSDYTQAIKLHPNTSLLAERAKVYDKLGDKVSAQRDRQRLSKEAREEF